MFEKDPDQDGVPPGHVAYILRWWTAIYEGGSVERIGLSSGLPTLHFGRSDSDASMRWPKFAGECSRLFLREDAQIDPAVFEIDAGEIPPDVMMRKHGPGES